MSKIELKRPIKVKNHLYYAFPRFVGHVYCPYCDVELVDNWDLSWFETKCPKCNRDYTDEQQEWIKSKC